MGKTSSKQEDKKIKEEEENKYFTAYKGIKRIHENIHNMMLEEESGIVDNVYLIKISTIPIYLDILKSHKILEKIAERQRSEVHDLEEKLENDFKDYEPENNGKDCIDISKEDFKNNFSENFVREKFIIVDKKFNEIMKISNGNDEKVNINVNKYEIKIDLPDGDIIIIEETEKGNGIYKFVEIKEKEDYNEDASMDDKNNANKDMSERDVYLLRKFPPKKDKEKEQEKEEKEEEKEEKEEEKEEKEKIYNQNNNSFNNYNEYYNDDEIMDENYINSIQVNHDLTNIDADCKNKTRKANFDENKNKNSYRKDNLFNRLKTRLIDFFIKDLHEIDNKKPEEKKEDEINNVEKENGDKKLEKYRVIKNENNEKKRKPRYQTKEAYKNFLEANFEETDRIKNLNINIIPKYREQIKTSKIKYLENIMNNENKRDELIKYEFSEKEKRCQKGKCRKLAYKITETKNLKGMILLTKLVKMDKTKYIKIKDTNEFITVINKLDGYEKYDNELTTKETEEIKGGIEVFESIAKDPFTTFLNHKKRGRKPKNQK